MDERVHTQTFVYLYAICEPLPLDTKHSCTEWFAWLEKYSFLSHISKWVNSSVIGHQKRTAQRQTHFLRELKKKKKILMKHWRVFTYLKVGAYYSLCKIVEYCQIQNANITFRTPEAVNSVLLKNIATISLEDIVPNIDDRTNTLRA